MHDERLWLAAHELVAAYRARQLSVVEVVDAVLGQMDRLNDSLRAVVTRVDDQARAAARVVQQAFDRGDALGLLAGVPITVKDLHATTGVRTTFGSRLFTDYVPREDQLLVARLRGAGAIVVGKTNTSEFGILPLAMNALFGESCNPWDLSLNTGGSSGGAAAAVACGLGPLATGSDGGGSIRIPAAFCGVFGLKPQFGRVPRLSFPRGWETLSHDGPLARTVRDAARFLDVVSGPDVRDRHSLPAQDRSFEAACQEPVAGLQLAWSADLGGLPIEPEVRDICEQAARRFAACGCAVEDIALDLPDLSPAQQTIVLCEAAAAMADRRAEWEQVIFHPTRKMLPNADALTCRDLLEAHWARDDYTQRVAEVFTRYDALLTPVAGITATANGTLGPKAIAGQPIRTLAWLGFVVPWNMTGQPAASLPVGRTAAGLPVGLQVVGRPFDEVTVLRLCAAYEAANPWLIPRPPVCNG